MRNRLKMSLAMALTAAVCVPAYAMAEAKSKAPKVYHQSPFLNGMHLPPVKDRLPIDPKVTNEQPPQFLHYQIGRYGGTLRTVTTQKGWDADVFVMCNEPLLNTPGILGQQVTGNVLEGYKVSDNNKVYTFYMRKGLRWSDGVPVTVQDVKFAVEDVLFNKQLNPVFPAYLRAGGDPNGRPLKFRVINNYTFQFIFDKPYGDLPIMLAIQGWRGYTDIIKPFHYLKRFHIKYASPAQLKLEEKQAHVSDWVKLFTAKDITNWELTNPNAIGFPVLYPWMLVKATPTEEVFQRNPYYFKVDPAGNQLPYIDKIQSTLVQDMNTVVLKTISGQVDFSRESATLNNMPLYRKYQDKAGYVALLSKFHCPASVTLNWNYKDPEWQKVVSDIRFRKALDLAINRADLANEVYYGFAKPGEVGSYPYNLQEANKLLDQMGMKKGPDGFRTAPDGKPFSIRFEVAQIDPQIVPFTELIVSDWKQLGLNVTMKTIDASLWGNLNAADQLQATVDWVHVPLWYMQDWDQGNWAPLWWKYHTTNGKAGTKPPKNVEQFFHLIDEIATATPKVAQTKVYPQLIASLKKNIWFIQPLGEVAQPLIVNKNLGNVTDKGFAIGVNFAGEQLYFKK